MNRIRISCLAAAVGGLLIVMAGGRIARETSADDKNAAGDGEYGSITGTFVLDGEVPRLMPLVEKGNMNINDPAVCSAADIPDDSLVVDPATKGIANIFVYLPKAEQVHPRLKESAKKEVDFDQEACRFIPHALVVRTDQVVRVKSNDNCTHNTKTNPRSNQPVNFILAANDRTGVEVKNRLAEKLPIEVQCNVHNWMNARWLILDHPYGTVSDKDGRFTIADLPAGEHEFVVWQERVGYLERKYKVKVVSGKTTDLGTIKVSAGRFAEKK